MRTESPRITAARQRLDSAAIAFDEAIENDASDDRKREASEELVLASREYRAARGNRMPMKSSVEQGLAELRRSCTYTPLELPTFDYDGES